MNFDNNEILVLCLKKGDEKAYDFLVRKYHRKLNAYAISLIKDTAKAKDILQNVFLSTWIFRKNLKPEFPIQNFLYKAVYNEFVTLYRQELKLLPLQQVYNDLLITVAKEMEEENFKKIISLVTKEIENLPPKCRRVFEMSKIEGLTNAEIAEYLEISVKTVEAQVTKAYSIIRKKLGDKVENTLFLLIVNKLFH